MGKLREFNKELDAIYEQRDKAEKKLGEESRKIETRYKKRKSALYKKYNYFSVSKVSVSKA